MPIGDSGSLRFLALLLSAFALLLVGCGTSSHDQLSARLHPSLQRTVMVGYQGWFRTPNDGAEMGWAHYEEVGGNVFAPGHLSIDYWPDTSELPAGSRHQTSFSQVNGEASTVFSSHDPQVVDVHFRWMREYGIDGAFVQRFAAAIIGDDAQSLRRRRAADNVLRFALASAERHGRSVAVMYDLSGLSTGAMAKVMADWRHLVDDLQVLRNPAYQWHRDHPVVAVWGVGFDDGRAYTLDEIASLVAFLKRDLRYGRNTLMCGIPTWWREQTADAVTDPKLPEVLAQADILSPWSPGRYYDLGGVQAHAERFWKPDKAWCDARGLDYMPVVFAGFSWRNLKRATGGIDRLDGRFLWEQYHQLVNQGCTMIYQAMFDEMDEGTQIFKISNAPPVGSYFRTYSPLPADHYLWLVKAAAGQIHRGNPLPERMPERLEMPEISRYLAGGDDAVYGTVSASLNAQRRFFQVADALTGQGKDWASMADGTRVRVDGIWFPRLLWSTDPHASMTWEVGVPGRDCLLAIRYPADPNQDHATSARLLVTQGGVRLLEKIINLRQGGLRWIEIGTVQPPATGPVQISLTRAAGSGNLVMFEPRLRPTL